MNNNNNCYVYKANPSIVGYSTFFFFASAKWLRVSANVRKREKCIPRYLMYMNACSNGIVDHVVLPDRQVQIYTCSCKGDSQLHPFM